jgi:membrane protein implicated in regulation of membrane protease activity
MKQRGWHWLLRAALAVVVTFGLDVVIRAFLARCLSTAAYANPALHVSLSLATLSVPVAIYALLTWRFGPRPDDETRCRRCRYILRGISESRCPECGERI